MRICIYDKNATKNDLMFLGLGEVDCIISCRTIERENEEYYAELEVDKKSKVSGHIKKMNILNIDNEYFRIRNIDKSSKTNSIKVHAKQITYDLDLDLSFDKKFRDNLIRDIFFDLIPVLQRDTFTLETKTLQDIKMDIEFEVTTYTDAIKLLFEEYFNITGKALQITRKQFKIEIGEDLGVETGIKFDAFKLEDINETEDNNDYCTRLVPVGVVGSTKLYLDEKYVIAKDYIQEENYKKHITKLVEFNDVGDVETLRKRGQEEVDKRFRGIKNVKVKLSNIINTETYKDLKYYNNINVGDYIEIDVDNNNYFYNYKIIQKEKDYKDGYIYTVGDKLENNIINSLGIRSKIEEGLKKNNFTLKYSKNDEIFTITTDFKKVTQYIVNLSSTASLSLSINLFYKNILVGNTIEFYIEVNGIAYPFNPVKELATAEDFLSFSIPIFNAQSGTNIILVKVKSKSTLEIEPYKLNTILTGSITGETDIKRSPDMVFMEHLILDNKVLIFK